MALVEGVHLITDTDEVTLAQDLVPGLYRCYGEQTPSLHLHKVVLDPEQKRVWLEYTQEYRPNLMSERRSTYTPWNNEWYMVLEPYIIEELGLT